MSTIPIELQGEGTYTYECKKRDCCFCELMSRDKNLKPNYYTKEDKRVLGKIVYRKRAAA